jgi:hypothetical protein
MSAPRRTPAAHRCLRVIPRPRGGWVVLAPDGPVVSEHSTVTEAEQAALAHLREGDELIVYDCYHRCHRSGQIATRRSGRARRERIGH